MFKDRISGLESSMNSLNQNVNGLSNLMHSALKSLNSELKIALTDNYKPMEVKMAHNNEKIAVLVLACNRPMSIESHLSQILK
jgi:hypothetical protein